MIKETQGVIVYVSHLRNLKVLKKFGMISFASKRLKYVVLYVNSETIEQVLRRLNAFPWVKKVDLSYKPQLRTHFETTRGEKEKDKELNY